MLNDDFLNVLINYFDDFNDEDLEDYFSASTNYFCDTELGLSLKSDFKIKPLIISFKDSKELLQYLYEIDSHDLLAAIICNNHSQDCIGFVSSYNRFEEEFNENSDDFDWEKPSDNPYLYMSDYFQYKIETKNYIYSYDYSPGEEVILINGIINKENLNNI